MILVVLTSDRTSSWWASPTRASTCPPWRPHNNNHNVNEKNNNNVNDVLRIIIPTMLITY